MLRRNRSYSRGPHTSSRKVHEELPQANHTIQVEVPSDEANGPQATSKNPHVSLTKDEWMTRTKDSYVFSRVVHD